MAARAAGLSAAAPTPTSPVRSLLKERALACSELPAMRDTYGRVVAYALRRLCNERSHLPVASRFLQSLVELVSTQHMVSAAARSEGGGDGDGEGEGEGEGRAASAVPSAALACSQFGEDALLPGGADFESVIDPAMDEPIPPYPTDWQPVNPGYKGGDGATQATTSRDLEDGLVNSDDGWTLWSGMIVQHPTTWKRPARSVNRVNDGGDGAYPLIPGCYVTRGPNAPKREKKSSKAELEKEEAERIAPKLSKAALSSDLGGSSDLTSALGAAEEEEKKAKEAEEAAAKTKKDEETAAAAAAAEPERPETEIGIVEEITSWDGVVGAGRRVRWLHDDSVEECRWGASDCFDILAIEPNKEKDGIKKVLPLPETRETIAKRRHFGQDTVRYGVLLRVRASATLNADPNTADGGGGGGDEWQSVAVDGTLEFPDFGAMVYVTGERWPDNSLKIVEKKLLAGSADSGWASRFAQNAWRPGTEYELAPAYGGAAETESGGVSNDAQRVLGSYSYKVALAGESVEVNGDVELCTGTLFTLDPLTAPQGNLSLNPPTHTIPPTTVPRGSSQCSWTA